MVYIGQTSQPLSKRWANHVYHSKLNREDNRAYNSPLQSDIRSFGKDVFAKEVLTVCETKQEANILEDKYILELNTLYPNGYNRDRGGYINSDTTKEKKRLSATGKEVSEETRLKLSVINMGENNAMYGKHHTEEAKAKISEGCKAKWRDEEYRAVMTEKIRTVSSDEAYKEKISERTQGSNNPRAKAVLCVETGTVFGCAKDASTWAGLKTNSNLLKACKGIQDTAGGYHWRFVDG